MPVRTMFATPLYDEPLGDDALIGELVSACRSLMVRDRKGLISSLVSDYRGYTSYDSIRDLPRQDATFATLVGLLDGHAAAFVRTCGFKPGAPPRLDRIWANIMKPGGYHASHLHHGSVIAGTVYLEVPRGAGAIRFEDPRLAMMMAAPERDDHYQRIDPRAGNVMLWESWLRHEVLPNRAKSDRISISFNYRY